MTQKRRGFFENLLDGVKEGYDKQDKKILEEKLKEENKFGERSVAGTAEGIANPLNWIKSLIQ